MQTPPPFPKAQHRAATSCGAAARPGCSALPALMLPAVRTALISYRPTGRSLRIRPSCADISTRMHVKYLGRESRAVDYSGSLISGRGKSRARLVLLIISLLAQSSSTATSAAPRKLHRQRRGCATS